MDGSLVVTNDHGDVPLGADVDHTTVRRTNLFLGGQNGLFSPAHIASGEIILSISKPFVLLPDNEAIGRLCNYCFKSAEDSGSGKDLKKCAGCQLAVYCSRECQEAGWIEGHRWECKAFKMVKEGRTRSAGSEGVGLLPTPVRTLIVLFMKYLNLKRRGLVDDQHKNFWGLVSNSAHWKLHDHESVMLQSMAAMKYGGIADRPGRLEEVEEAWCILKTNAFRASSAAEPVGLCFEPKLALANHSCAPSAEIGFEGRTLFMRALRDIEEGEEIVISYIDESQPLKDRQEHLKTHYLFDCGCSLCTEEGKWQNTEDVVD